MCRDRQVCKACAVWVWHLKGSVRAENRAVQSMLLGEEGCGVASQAMERCAEPGTAFMTWVPKVDVVWVGCAKSCDDWLQLQVRAGQLLASGAAFKSGHVSAS